MKIKLGKLPNTTNVRITISLPEALKGKLDRYAQLHSQTWGQKVDAAALVPHILAQFLANDRAFRSSEKEAATSKLGTSTEFSLARPAQLFETSTAGIFAIGDVRCVSIERPARAPLVSITCIRRFAPRGAWCAGSARISV